MACDLEQDYIYIYKGDDTNWNNEQFVTFNVSPATGAQIDLADMTAEFILGSYSKKNISLATGTFDIDLNAATSGSFAYGPIYGSIKIYDTDKRVKTVANKIPFYITDNVIAAQNQTRTIEVPQGSEVTIDITVGGSVSYNNLTDLPTLNGVTIQGNGTYATYNLPTKAQVQANTQAISAEVQNRQNADTALQGNLNAHIANKNNPHEVTKAQIGLGNVDNTADADKPISNATQSALNAKQNTLTTAQQAAVDSGVTSATVAQVQTNKENIATIEAELEENREWQKPADWIDIRSGALPNSIYFLVGHSADYSSYPIFSLKANVSNSGTYDVYIDGIKQFTTANGTTTTINWQTLALASGWDVTYPTELHTHIVRITPTDLSNSLTLIQGFDAATTVVQNGLLWVHFTTSERISVAFGSTTGTHAPILESITTNQNDELFANLLIGFVTNLNKLKHLPTINCEGVGFRPTYSFYKCASPIKKLRLKKCKATASYSEPFTAFSKVEEIITEDCLLVANPNMFRQMNNLKKLPACIDFSKTSNYTDFLKGCTSLENTVIDLSWKTTLTGIRIGGSSTERIDGMVGLTVSSSAPLNNATSPQINVSYTGLDRAALVNLFNSMPTVTDSQVCNITGATGANDLTAADLAIATAKGWTVTR